ncbi:MAG: DUF4301 family protein [Bacteroidales bacterium]
MFTQEDLNLLERKGISVEKVEKQLDAFKQGFPFLKLKDCATVGNGIMSVQEDDVIRYQRIWDKYLHENKQILKFVPASGAASRMFKNLFEFLGASYEVPTTDFEKNFFGNIAHFAFYHDLDQVCQVNEGKSIEELIEAGQYKAVVRNLLEGTGLNYGALPKGLLKFHNYQDAPRTAMEEHLVEGALYAANGSGEVNLHFTVSPEHKTLFESLANEKKAHYEKQFGVKYHIGFSIQKSSTDTIAADAENQPFRDHGNLLFRPGGHGALIENLNELKADVIFIKNIDNVVPDTLKDTTVKYKQLLGGVLVAVQQQIFAYLDLLETGKYSHDQLLEMLHFLQSTLCVKHPETKTLEDSELALYLISKFKRPLRVCGMVKNVGEPGGGPFLAFNPDGTYSPQILESSQIDMADAASKALFAASTHFNPVDLVCAVRDKAGNAYDLQQYIDPQTGFISLKSKSGRDLKALELPGLWNGAMSDWNTVFVEVPVDTFNPVKTVNDLLREQHQ